MKLFNEFAFAAVALFLIGCTAKQPGAASKAPAAADASTPAQPVKDSAFAVISVDRTKKTLYRGIKNPLTIIVPNAVATKVEGNGVVKTDDFGHYKISPGPAMKTDIKITASMRDGSTFTETRTFNVRNIPNPKLVLHNTGLAPHATSLTEEEIARAEVGLQMQDFDYDLDFIITGFKVEFPYGINVDIEGTKFTGKALEMIKKMKHNGEVKIHSIRTAPLSYGDMASLRIDPILIKVNKKARPKK